MYKHKYVEGHVGLIYNGSMEEESEFMTEEGPKWSRVTAAR